jgi:hypothetical protein
MSKQRLTPKSAFSQNWFPLILTVVSPMPVLTGGVNLNAKVIWADVEKSGVVRSNGFGVFQGAVVDDGAAHSKELDLGIFSVVACIDC